MEELRGGIPPEELEFQEKEEIGIGEGLRKRKSGWGRGLFIAIVMILVVVGSFWASFLIGKSMLTPVKSLSTEGTLPLEEVAPILLPEIVPQEGIVPEKIEIPIKKEAPVVGKKTGVKVKSARGGPLASKWYKVQAGAFKDRESALELEKQLKLQGYPTHVYRKAGLWEIQVGAFKAEWRAKKLVGELQDKGFKASIK